jgi:hypothetical protein
MRHATEFDRHAVAANAADNRARAIARGLLVTGRARRPTAAREDGLAEFMRLERRTAPGASYWVRRDGGEIRSGVSFATAERLQPGFIAAMERAGAS